MLIERLLLTAAIVGVLALAWLALRAWGVHRGRGVRWGPLGLRLDGSKPHILYFSGEGCSECRTRQAPTLAQMESELDGAVKVVEFDAWARLDLVQALGVLTLPTTVILDAMGRVRRINDGYADLQKLRRQVGEIQELV